MAHSFFLSISSIFFLKHARMNKESFSDSVVTCFSHFTYGETVFKSLVYPVCDVLPAFFCETTIMPQLSPVYTKRWAEGKCQGLDGEWKFWDGWSEALYKGGRKKGHVVRRMSFRHVASTLQDRSPHFTCSVRKRRPL